MFIETETTPNPASLKFLPGQQVMAQGTREFASPEAAEASPLAQAIFDLLFSDMDQNLREMGTGDMGVGKKIKAMAEAFYGRLKAYEDGLTGEGSLEEALDRNLYRNTTPLPAHIEAFALYMRREARQLLAKGSEGTVEVDGVQSPQQLRGHLQSLERR